ncbi:MAG: hypothetical protein U0790_01090 [Isosphaeraceae bacterium]
MDDRRRMIDHAKGARHRRRRRGHHPGDPGLLATLAEDDPTYMPVTPEPFAQVARCYSNVLDACSLTGGTPHSRLIWELPGIYLTAEHHAVVERDGHLYDVTPQIHGETRVLFLPIPDPRPSRRACMPNRYMSPTDHGLVRRANWLIEANDLPCFGRIRSSRRNDEEAAACMDEYLRLIRFRGERIAATSISGQWKRR